MQIATAMTSTGRVAPRSPRFSCNDGRDQYLDDDDRGDADAEQVQPGPDPARWPALTAGGALAHGRISRRRGELGRAQARRRRSAAFLAPDGLSNPLEPDGR